MDRCAPQEEFKRNRRASDYPQEDQRDRQTSRAIVFSAITDALRRLAYGSILDFNFREIRSILHSSERKIVCGMDTFVLSALLTAPLISGERSNHSPASVLIRLMRTLVCWLLIGEERPGNQEQPAL